MSVARCSFLVLGEDSAGDAPETLLALAKKLLRLVDQYHDDQHIRFEPPTGAGVRAALRGNLWKSQNPKDYRNRLDLIGYIATKLLEGERAFVLYHLDGDRTWAERESGENARQFHEFIQTDVRRFVEHRLGQSAEISLSRLLLMLPFYSIEAWVYQNTLAGRRFCEENDRCRGKHVALFEAWEKDRPALDEVHKPKEEMCFKGRHNHALAEGLDAEAVYYAGKSLHATVEALMQREPLLRALAATRPG